MKLFHFFIVIVLAMGASATVSFYIDSHNTFPTTYSSAPSDRDNKKETVFERVIRTNTLRCGYAVASPWFMVDPETKEFSGYSYEGAMAIINKMGLDVDWVEESGWGIAEQGIVSGRYDAMCATVCVDPQRIKAVQYARPYKHVPMFALTRADDTRFDEDRDLINSPDIKVGVKNGHIFEYIANEVFPKAQKVYANDISDDTDFLLMLETKKIDIAFSGQITLDLYTKQKGETIKTVGEPARYCNGAFMLPHGEAELKHMVDAAVTELNAAKVFHRIAEKYMPLDARYISLPAQQHEVAQ